MIGGVILVGCGGGEGSGIRTPAGKPTPEASATPLPYTPEPEPTPAGPPGRVATTVRAVCRLSFIDAEIAAVYSATVYGPSSRLKRVRLLLNNKVAEDSGDIFTTSYENTVVLHVSPGASYSLSVAVSATNATGPTTLNVVRCPASSGPAT